MWPSTTKYFSPFFSYTVSPPCQVYWPDVVFAGRAGRLPRGRESGYADVGVRSKPRYSAASSGLANMMVRSSLCQLLRCFQAELGQDCGEPVLGGVQAVLEPGRLRVRLRPERLQLARGGDGPGHPDREPLAQVPLVLAGELTVGGEQLEHRDG